MKRLVVFGAFLFLGLSGTVNGACRLTIKGGIKELHYTIDLKNECRGHLGSFGYHTRTAETKDRVAVVYCAGPNVGGTYQIRLSSFAADNTNITQGMVQSFFAEVRELNLNMTTSEWTNIDLLCSDAIE